MATYFNLGQLFGGQLFELFARETNLKKQSSVGGCVGQFLMIYSTVNHQRGGWVASDALAKTIFTHFL